MRKGVQKAQALCARVQGVQLPMCGSRAAAPPRRSDALRRFVLGYCLTHESAGLQQSCPLPYGESLKKWRENI